MKKQVLLFVLMLMPLMASAQIEINGIYYFLNSTNKVAEVNSPESFVPYYAGSITIPNTVTYGGVTYSVTSIGWSAFYGCSGLTSVTIPNSVREIGELAFFNNSSLKSVNISDIAAWCNISFYDNPLYYAHHLFLNGKEVKDLNIPNNVTSISNCAFQDCSGLTSVSIPNSVTSIGSLAFQGCSGLTSVSIPNSVTSIGRLAFHGCSGLPVVKNCRYADTYLVEVVDKTIAVCEIKEGTRFIGDSAFSSCSKLTTLTIPNSVTTLGEQAFNGCSGLISLFIGDGITSIGSKAFNNLSKLKSLTIGNGVTTIGNNAFQGCSVLSSVNIGKGIKSVGSKAFANCPEIKEVYCYAKDVPTISNDTFENSYYIKWATLYVPESSVDLYKASAWSQFGNIVGITGGNEGERCEKPVITLLANGKIKVESATEGATCVTNITASNVEPLSDGEISLNTPLIVYTVTSYATKEGYNDSEVATATFRYEKAEGDMNGDGMLNITDVIHLVNMILGQ